MTEAEKNNWQKLETRVRQLILAYVDKERAYEALEAKVAYLEKEIATQREMQRQLQADYNSLRTASLIVASGDDVHEARQRLTHLIREVDKCIALLNI